MAFCQNCGVQISDRAVICVKCGAAVPQRPAAVSSVNDDAALRMLLPIGRSGLSIAAGYLGLLSLIPFFGVLALIVGILAIVDIKKHPEKHGLGRAWFGVVMGGVMSLAWLILFCLAAVYGG